MDLDHGLVQELRNLLLSINGRYNLSDADKAAILVLDNEVQSMPPGALITLGEIATESHNCAAEKGWWPGLEGGTDPDFLHKCALVGTEVAEAIEEFRKGHAYDHIYYREADGKPEGIAPELADVIIRVFDMCGRWGVPITEAMLIKSKFNRTRPFRHGGKTA